MLILRQKHLGFIFFTGYEVKGHQSEEIA